MGAAPDGVAVVHEERTAASFRLTAQAVGAEFETSATAKAHFVLPDACQRELRHGRDPDRAIQRRRAFDMQEPTAPDRGATAAGRIRFASTILPKRACRRKSLDALPSVLRLRKISAGDFQEPLGRLVPTLTSRGADTRRGE